MPTELTTWVALGLLGIIVVLLVLNTINIKKLRRHMAEQERLDAAAEQHVRALLGHKDPEEEEQRPRMWLVPMVTGLAAATGTMLSAAKNNAGPVAVGLAGVAAVTTLVIAGSSTSDARRAEPAPPAVVVPTDQPRSPSYTTELPANPTATPSTRGTRTGLRAGTTDAAETPLTTMLPTGVPDPPTVTVTPTSEIPTLTTTPTADCLLDVELNPLLDLCVA